MSTKIDIPLDLALSVRNTASQPLLLDFTGDALANILNLTDPDSRRKLLMMVPPKRQHYMSAEMMALINHMAGAPKGQGARFDSPSRVRAIFFLLKSAQCRLCTRGREHEALLLRYLQSRSSFGLIGSSVTTAEEKHRKKFRGIEFLATAKGAQNLVVEILAETFGKAPLTSSIPAKFVGKVREIALPAERIYGAITDEPMVFDFFSGFFDFRHHTDTQIVQTVGEIEKLVGKGKSTGSLSAIKELFAFSDGIEHAIASYLPPNLRK